MMNCRQVIDRLEVIIYYTSDDSANRVKALKEEAVSHSDSSQSH